LILSLILFSTTIAEHCRVFPMRDDGFLAKKCTRGGRSGSSDFVNELNCVLIYHLSCLKNRFFQIKDKDFLI